MQEKSLEFLEEVNDWRMSGTCVCACERKKEKFSTPQSDKLDEANIFSGSQFRFYPDMSSRMIDETPSHMLQALLQGQSMQTISSIGSYSQTHE